MILRGLTPSRRLGLVLGTTQVLSWAVTFYVPAVATTPVADAFGTGTAPVVGAFSWALLLTGLCAPRVGRLIDRHGGRPVMAAGAAASAAGLLVLASSQGLMGWYAGWTIVGIGMAGSLYDAAFASAGRTLGMAARPVITGITLIGGFASTVGWPVGAFLVAQLGWRAMLVAYAATMLLAVLPLALLIPRPPPVARRVVPAGTKEAPTPGLVPFSGFLTVRALVQTTVSVYVPVLLAGMGLSTADAVAIASLIGPAQVAARLGDVALGRWMTPLVATWVGAAMLPVGVVLLLSGLPPWVGGLLFVASYGISNGILTICRGALPLWLWGAEGYAGRVGRIALPVLLAQAAAPVLAAPLVSGLPAREVFLVMGALGLLAGLCLLPLRPPAADPSPDQSPP